MFGEFADSSPKYVGIHTIIIIKMKAKMCLFVIWQKCAMSVRLLDRALGTMMFYLWRESDTLTSYSSTTAFT